MGPAVRQRGGRLRLRHRRGSDGASYLTGDTYGSLPGNASSGNIDGFLVRYDVNGNRTWVRQFGNDGAVFGYAVAVDPVGNVLVGGWADVDMAGPTGLTGPWRAYVAQFTPQGARAWLRRFGASDMEKPVGLAVDASGGVLVGTSGVLPSASSASGHAVATTNPPPVANDALLLSYPP